MVALRAGDRGNPFVTLIGLELVHVECTTRLGVRSRQDVFWA
jgi:hypothetical protein